MGKIGQARGFLFFRIVNKFFSASEKKTKTRLTFVNADNLPVNLFRT